jgi:DNA replication protein DnaC
MVLQLVSVGAVCDTDLRSQRTQLGLTTAAQRLDDFIARATKGHWSPQVLLEELTRSEIQERSRIGRFKTIADFDWNWPKKIDRSSIERALTLDFIAEGRNLILMGSNSLGKTMIAKNIAQAALQAGHTVLFRTAPEILADLHCDSPQILRRKLNHCARPHLLAIDEVGYLSYDTAAADLLYEVVIRRYERRSILITTNKAFKDGEFLIPA